MPRYASFGRLDSQLVDDGDTAFVRINQRLRPDQLKPGEVAVSQNGRMDVDGAWQPRLGYYNVLPKDQLFLFRIYLLSILECIHLPNPNHHLILFYIR